MDSKNKIIIYFHICLINNWKNIVTIYFNKLLESGLLDECYEFRVSILGNNPENVIKIIEHPKLRIIFHSTEITLYERPCLNHIKSSSLNDDFIVFYLHSKGVSNKNINNSDYILDWSNMMLYFLVERWKQFIKLLDNQVALGVNCRNVTDKVELSRNSSYTLKSKSTWHFSGNFWWANSKYVATLPDNIGNKYLDPELWIGQGYGLLINLFESNINHYKERFPKIMYLEKWDIKFIDLRLLNN